MRRGVLRHVLGHPQRDEVHAAVPGRRDVPHRRRPRSRSRRSARSCPSGGSRRSPARRIIASVFGEAVDPTGRAAAGRRAGHVLRPRPAAPERSCSATTCPQHTGFRNVMVGAERHGVRRRRRRAPPRVRAGRVGNCASTPTASRAAACCGPARVPTRDGTVYFATQNPDRLFALRNPTARSSRSATRRATRRRWPSSPTARPSTRCPGAHGSAGRSARRSSPSTRATGQPTHDRASSPTSSSRSSASRRPGPTTSRSTPRTGASTSG